MGEEAAGENREPLSPFEKKVGAFPTFPREKFSQGVLLVQTRPEEPGIALPAWRRCLCASPLAPLLLLPARAAPLPPHEAPNGYPVTPRGGGCSAASRRRRRRRSGQPLDPAAARPRVGSRARRWKRTRETGGPEAGAARAGC